MYPIYDPGCCLPLLGGIALGACVANEHISHDRFRETGRVIRDAKPNPQPTVYQLTTTTTNPPMLIANVENHNVLYRVKVPSGIRPGQTFVFYVDKRMFTATCPENCVSGDEILVNLPCVNFLTMGSIAEHHFEQAKAIVAYDHPIDETKKENIHHQILSAKAGDKVTILGGTIENGLPPPYSEYCRVRFDANGKVGLVSKFVLKYVGENE
jgi:hypothetical protein